MKRTALGLSTIFWLAAVLSFHSGDSIESTKTKAKILVGPNILASRDGEVPHIELMVAMNPKNPKNLLGAAITFTRPDGRTACKTYSSLDGGYTWSDSSFPEQIQFREGGFDPQVAFGLSGTAYFCALANYREKDGTVRSAIHFYRSEDGGLTWGRVTDFGPDYDHEQMVVDHTYGAYAGRVYVGAAYGTASESIVGVLRSEDDGRTFVGPVKFASGEGKVGLSVANMLILSDGSLFVPYEEYAIGPESADASPTNTFWSVISGDGGVTFGSPNKIQVQQLPRMEQRRRESREGNFARVGYPMFAVDSTAGERKDRLYTVWPDVRFGNPRLLFSSSKDRGNSWAEPKLIDADTPQWSSQFQPMCFVNREGVLGLMWFDTRASDKNDRYDLYFTASLDGGETFLPAVRVSSAPSFPGAEINLVPSHLFGINRAGSINVRTLSAFTRWGDGGDYMGLTATADGLFHPFWADSRSKCFQIWTCAIAVRSGKEVVGHETTSGSQDVALAGKRKVLLNTQLELVYDPIRYDPASRVAILPVRLKNISEIPLQGPFFVKIKALFPEDELKYVRPEWLNVPEVLNASNREKGAGAEFDYSSSLRDFESLDPGALTEAVEWKFRFSNRLLTDFDLEIEILGFTSQEQSAQLSPRTRRIFSFGLF